MSVIDFRSREVLITDDQLKQQEKVRYGFIYTNRFRLGALWVTLSLIAGYSWGDWSATGMLIGGSITLGMLVVGAAAYILADKDPKRYD